MYGILLDVLDILLKQDIGTIFLRIRNKIFAFLNLLPKKKNEFYHLEHNLKSCKCITASHANWNNA